MNLQQYINIMAESKLVQLNLETVASYNVSSIVCIYVFNMLRLGRILISHLVDADLFMHLLSSLILLYLATPFLH